MADEAEDDAPVVFKSSRTNRKLRNRSTVSSNVDVSEPSEPSPTVENAEKISLEKNQDDSVEPSDSGASAKKLSSKLSFADENDDAGVDILQFKKKKKSSLAEKEKKKREKLAESSSSQSLQTGFMSAADDYSPAALENLRKTNNLGFVLKPLQKASGATQDSLEALGIVTEITDDIETAAVAADADADRMIVDEPLPVDVPLMSASEIAKIKAKRDRIRKFGTAAASGADGALERDQEFVALGKDDDDDNSDSRLVRDSLFDDDEAEVTVAMGQDYNGGRINFGDPGKQYSTKLDSTTKQSRIDDRMEEDEEWRRWETQQILKSGVRRSADEEKPKTKSATSVASIAFTPTPIPSLDSILESLDQEISNVQTAHVQNRLHLSKMQGNIHELDESIDTLQAEYREISENFSFFEDMKKYIFDLLDCVGEKIETIQTLEKDWLDASIKRIRAAWRRASQIIMDDKERVKELMSGIAPPPEKLQSRESRQADRDKLRSRAATRRATEYESGWISDEDDYSVFVSGEINPEASDLAFEEETTFAETCRELYKRGVAIFDDVYDDYSDVRTIAERFQDWKTKDPKSYEQTYVSLALPQLFDAFVRLELLQNEWDPLFKSPLFDGMRWYRFLSSYGGDDMAENDEDRNLVPNLVEKSLLPRVKSMLNVLWDPISARQNARVLLLVEELLVYLPIEKLVDIMALVRVNLQGACDRVDLLAIPSEMLLDRVQHAELINYETKQLGQTVKIIRNCFAWAKFVPLRHLLTSTGPVIDERLVPHLRGFVTQPGTLSICLRTINDLLSCFPADLQLSEAFPVLHSFIITSLKRRSEELSSSLSEKDRSMASSIFSRVK